MSFTPFTFDEATEIWDDFEDLVDTEFILGPAKEYLIHDVVVAPFDQSEKSKFISLYNDTHDGKGALDATRASSFDVLVVASDVYNESSAYTYFDIRTFTLGQGIQYGFPVHD